MIHKIVLADNQQVFRTGTARFMAVEDDFRITGQCDDLQRLYKICADAVATTICFASSLEPDLPRMKELVTPGRNRLLAILECSESPQPYVALGVQGLIYRHVTRVEMVKCFRTVATGGTYHQQPSAASSARFETDMVGERVRNRLSPKEIQILRLLIRGYKNKDIAAELNNTEQVIKNYLRSIFDKTGVSDRLELALFTMHHRILLEAVVEEPKKEAAPAPANPEERQVAPVPNIDFAAALTTTASLREVMGL